MWSVVMKQFLAVVFVLGLLLINSNKDFVDSSL